MSDRVIWVLRHISTANIFCAKKEKKKKNALKGYSEGARRRMFVASKDLAKACLFQTVEVCRY